MPRVWTLLKANGKDTFWSPDFILGLVACAVLTVTGLTYRSVRANGANLLTLEGSLAVAVLGLVLTALAVFVAFMDEDYISMLQTTSRGVGGAIRPYMTICVISGITALAGVSLGGLWSLLPWWLKGVALGAVDGLFVWAIVGTMQLVGITAWHGRMRARVPEIRAAAREARNNGREVQ